MLCASNPEASNKGELNFVFLHGLGSEIADLRPLAELCPGRRLIVDLPGFGQSPMRTLNSLADYVEAVLEAMDAHGLEKAIWVGTSFGGHVTLRAALNHPERIQAAFLVSSGGYLPSAPAEVIAHFQEPNLKARQLDDVQSDCQLLTVQSNELTEAFVQRRLEAHKTGQYQALATAARMALKDNCALSLEHINTPIHIVHGRHDPMIPVTVAEAAKKRLPHATMDILEDTGHMPWLEAPQAVAACIHRCLSRAFGA